MDNNRQSNPQQTGNQGSGSAENRDSTRQDQVNMGAEQSRSDIAQQTGLSGEDISSLDDLGMRSGRDDYSGGSGDRMEDQDTGQPTDR